MKLWLIVLNLLSFGYIERAVSKLNSDNSLLRQQLSNETVDREKENYFSKIRIKALEEQLEIKNKNILVFQKYSEFLNFKSQKLLEKHSPLYNGILADIGQEIVSEFIPDNENSIIKAYEDSKQFNEYLNNRFNELYDLYDNALKFTISDTNSSAQGVWKTGVEVSIKSDSKKVDVKIKDNMTGETTEYKDVKPIEETKEKYPKEVDNFPLMDLDLIDRPKLNRVVYPKDYENLANDLNKIPDNNLLDNITIVEPKPLISYETPASSHAPIVENNHTNTWSSNNHSDTSHNNYSSGNNDNTSSNDSTCGGSDY